MTARPILTARPRLAVKPPGSTAVRLVAAVLRCRQCHTAWQSPLNEWCEPVAEAQCCPRCDANRTPPAAA